MTGGSYYGGTPPYYEFAIVFDPANGGMDTTLTPSSGTHRFVVDSTPYAATFASWITATVGRWGYTGAAPVSTVVFEQFAPNLNLRNDLGIMTDWGLSVPCTYP
jgi:hypothetical protein